MATTQTVANMVDAQIAEAKGTRYASFKGHRGIATWDIEQAMYRFVSRDGTITVWTTDNDPNTEIFDKVEVETTVETTAMADDAQEAPAVATQVTTQVTTVDVTSIHVIISERCRTYQEWNVAPIGNTRTPRGNAKAYALRHGYAGILYADGRYVTYSLRDNNRLSMHTYRNARVVRPS